MSKNLLGIVTVTYNSEKFLAEFFESCFNQKYNEYRVYCIDNHSRDSTRQILEGNKDPRWNLIFNSDNKGVAAANNQGILSALEDGCEWVLLLNNDTAFPSTLFGELIEACRSNDWFVCVPKIYFDDPKGVIWYGGGGFNPRRGYTGFHLGKDEVDIGQRDFPVTVDYAPTCCMLVHCDVFGQVGLMDETYFVYFDDTDFCWRLRGIGAKIGYWPAQILVHKVGGSTGGGDSPFTAGITARNRLYFLRKHKGCASAIIWLPIFAAYYVFLFGVIRRNTACLKASLSGCFKWGGLTPSIPALVKYK